jgi:putative acetyltransferase
MEYTLRTFRSADAPRLSEVFREAVRVVGAHEYTVEQTSAWLARAPAIGKRLLARVEQGHWIVVAADSNSEAVAYALMEPDGHLDHLYCHPLHTRQGLADRLLAAAEQHSRALKCNRLFTEASELARPAFERAGYIVTHRRNFTIEHEGREVPIHNYAMEKHLE